MERLIEDEEIPPQFEHGGCKWYVTSKMRNYYTRVLAMPIFGSGEIANGGRPKWFSNKEVAEILIT